MPNRIRPATANDLQTILAFEQGVVLAERPFNPKIKDGIVHYYDMCDLIESDQAQVLVAEVEGRVVGTGYASLKTSAEYLAHDRHAYLGLMFVDSEHRGQGIIQDIISALLGWARGQGVHDFYLDVYVDNEPAVKAYERLGFRPNMFEMKLHD